MANSADLDETARYEPSHLDLHCFQRYLLIGLKWLRITSHLATLLLEITTLMTWIVHGLLSLQKWRGQVTKAVQLQRDNDRVRKCRLAVEQGMKRTGFKPHSTYSLDLASSNYLSLKKRGPAMPFKQQSMCSHRTTS